MRRRRLIVVLTAALTLMMGAAGCAVQGAPRSTSPPGATTQVGATSTAVPASTTQPSTTHAQTSLPPTSPSPLAGRVIVLDPGHNGRNREFPDEINQLVDIGTGMKACNTTGTQTAAGYPEAAFNWELAVATRRSLEARGAAVVLTRDDNDGWGPCITDRAAIGNAAGADVVVSIHADGGPPGGRGFHVIFPIAIPGLTDDIAERSEGLAITLRDAFTVTGMPPSDYAGVEGLSARSDLGGLNLSDVPVVFLEVGNMKNTADADLLTDPGFWDDAAAAITTALVTFLADS